nr:unnamed protein product [Callosobruchus analis]
MLMRQSISPEERLLVTLRYLATGRSMEDFKFHHHHQRLLRYLLF